MLDNLIQSVVDDVVNKSAGAKKCRNQCNSAEDQLRQEKEKHLILNGCSSIEESKKCYVRKCQDKCFTEKINRNPQTLLGSLKRTSEPMRISHMVDSYSRFLYKAPRCNNIVSSLLQKG